MWKELKSSAIALALFTALTGVAYPLFVTLVAQFAFHERANGSLVVEDGVVRGSALVGQSWTGDAWFHGRPSASGYDARASGATNLGPSNPALARVFAERAEALRAAGSSDPLPVDLLTASGSGLDPHVSPAAAYAQVARVAAARGLASDVVRALVDEHVERPSLGFLGDARVDVLALNHALRRRAPTGR